LVIDTNIYCDFAEGVSKTVDILSDYAETLYIPSVVIGELAYGFLKGNRHEWSKNKLRKIIQVLGITVIDMTQAVASKYGLIYLSLFRKGRKIPINDVLIAACCMEVGGTLLTRDRHFDHVDLIDMILVD
jgi:tRNA(fMet)-specific endonuclease VapC